MDLTTEIETSFGDGPAHRPVQQAIASGRRLVVRRRLAVGAGATATALVIGGAAWAIPPGAPNASSDGGPVATQPSTTDPTPRDRAGDPQSQLMRGELAAFSPDGTLIVRDGWRVSQRIQNPMRRQAPDRSLGLELTRGEQVFWYLLDLQGDEIIRSSDPAGKGFATLDDWVADQVALQGDTPSPSPVAFAPGTAQLVAVDDALMVRQQAGPDVPGFARPGDATAVAEVRWRDATYFVLARRTAGAEPEYFPTAATVPARPTLASFLEHAREQYGSGEGLR
jgi:hypothetical protein